MKRSGGLPAWLLVLALAAFQASPALAASDEQPEYRLKAAFLYNFALFTEWPAEVGATLNFCVFGKDPFGEEIDPLQGKKVGNRSVVVQRKTSIESLKGCQLVFITSAALASLPRLLDSLRGAPVLTVADSPGAGGQGVALNMIVTQDRIAFEANLQAVRGAGLALSSQLLRLATEVRR